LATPSLGRWRAMENSMSKLLKPTEAMALLHVRSKYTFLKLEKAGLTPTWIGGRRFYTADAVESFIRANTGRHRSPWAVLHADAEAPTATVETK
jgi:hypothetical protein